MSAADQAELLAAMDPDEAEPVRRLLTYMLEQKADREDLVKPID
jgi:hypothetical protein